MRITATLFVLTLLAATSCKKDKDDPAPATAPAPAACGTAGARLQATFDGNTWCPDLLLFADLAVHMTISGSTGSGSTLTLELDSISPGTYQMTESSNHILFTQLAGSYRSSDDTPATLTILEHDPATNRIRGTFTGPLVPPMGGAPKQITGSFDMFYLD